MISIGVDLLLYILLSSPLADQSPCQYLSSVNQVCAMRLIKMFTSNCGWQTVNNGILKRSGRKHFQRVSTPLWTWIVSKIKQIREEFSNFCGRYSGIPHLRKWILRKWDTASLKKVSSYKKAFSLNKYHFLITFSVYGSLHHNEPWALSTKWA